MGAFSVTAVAGTAWLLALCAAGLAHNGHNIAAIGCAIASLGALVSATLIVDSKP